MGELSEALTPCPGVASSRSGQVEPGEVTPSSSPVMPAGSTQGNEPGSVSVNGAHEDPTSPAGGADGSSGSTPECLVIINTPSGFQTRCIVKSFNRFELGKLGFSQDHLLYVPLDVPSPGIPDTRTYPVPTSQDGSSLKTHSLTG